MLSRKVDATLGAFWNYEGVDLRRAAASPTILRMEKLGVPTYNELIFVARREDLDAARRVEAAPLPARHRRAARSCCARDPAVGVDALLKADPGLDAGLQTDVVEATLPVFFPTDTDASRSAGRTRTSGRPTATGCAQQQAAQAAAGRRGAR